MTDATDPPTPTKPGYKTTEFWLSLAAKLLGAAFATGLIGDGTPLARIAGLAAVVLGALGYTVNRAIVKAAAALLVLGLFAGPQLACSSAKQLANDGKTAIVDCVKADAAPIEALLVELGADAITQVLHAGAVDWGALEREAEAQGVVVGGCAYSQFVHGRPSSPPAPVGIAALSTPPPAPDPAVASLERLRSAFNGARWQTSAGVL